MDELNRHHQADPPPTGYFGKVPSHGDFVTSGLSRPFQLALDRWIDKGMQMLRNSEDWEQRFHAMRTWRFVVKAPIWGDAIVVGILTPSRDRVGRSFPLIVASQITDYCGDLRALCFDKTWFMAAEAIGESIRFHDFDLKNFNHSVERLRQPHPRQQEDATEGPSEPCAIWWNIDCETHIADGFMTGEDLEACDFERLLPSLVESGPIDAAVAPVEAVIADAAPQYDIRHSQATHAGTRHIINADSLLVKAEPVLHAIADALYCTPAAVTVARQTTDTLSAVQTHAHIEAVLEDIIARLTDANTSIHTAGPVEQDPPNGASIAVLTLLHDHAALVWAGDTRCYRIRDGLMQCLTREHAEIGMTHRLSRFVGKAPEISPEFSVFPIMAGDRFALCSAGLVKVLGEHALASMLLEELIENAADCLVQEALISDARDNISAIVIDVCTTHQ